jgi:hypothetical protein
MQKYAVYWPEGGTANQYSVFIGVGIKHGYGQTHGRTGGRTDKKDKMWMRIKGIKCGSGQKG